MEDIGSRLTSVRERVSSAALRSGRAPEDVRIMAVSKFRPASDVAAAYRAGQRLFGESRVREAQLKSAEAFSVLEGAELHMIGHLQSNKAADAARIFSCVQSVDSSRLRGILGAKCALIGKSMDFLFEIHTAEDSKSGMRSADDLWRAMDEALPACDGLKPAGLMTMAPFTRDEGPIRSSFRTLAALGREWERRYPALGSPLLSMGMTNDFEIAIEEGSGMVRIGTAIFGENA